MRKHFGDRLKELRTENNLTQKELADKLHITPKMISFYELGERTPGDDIKIELSKIFNVTIDYLLGTSDIRNPYDDDPSNLPEEFTNPTDAMTFILKQPSVMAYGGYSLDDMTDEEILDFANDILIAVKITLEQKKKR